MGWHVIRLGMPCINATRRPRGRGIGVVVGVPFWSIVGRGGRTHRIDHCPGHGNE